MIFALSFVICIVCRLLIFAATVSHFNRNWRVLRYKHIFEIFDVNVERKSRVRSIAFHMREISGMFALVRNGFNKVWKNESSRPKEQESDVVNDEGFVLVPAVNRKRTLHANNNGIHDHEAKIKRESECSSMSDEPAVATSYSSLVSLLLDN